MENTRHLLIFVHHDVDAPRLKVDDYKVHVHHLKVRIVNVSKRRGPLRLFRGRWRPLFLAKHPQLEPFGGRRLFPRGLILNP